MKFEKLTKIYEAKDKFLKYKRGNQIPEGSNWTEFAKMFDIGVLDLENIAVLMGFEGFADLEISIGPESLLKRDKKKFIKALKDSSIKASKMKDDEIVSTIAEYYS